MRRGRVNPLGRVDRLRTCSKIACAACNIPVWVWTYWDVLKLRAPHVIFRFGQSMVLSMAWEDQGGTLPRPSFGAETSRDPAWLTAAVLAGLPIVYSMLVGWGAGEMRMG